MTLTVGSLFSGFGGLELGLEWAGMEVLWQVENNPHCVRALEANWPHVKRYGDINELDFTSLAPVDLLCGGFPCQPFSNAGKRKGKADDRYLWPRMLETIKAVRPTWILAENVDGIRSMVFERTPFEVVSRTVTRGEDRDDFHSVLTQQEIMQLDQVCQEIEEAGYEVQPIVVPACAVDSPQIRARIFIVAHAKSFGRRTGFRQGGEEPEIGVVSPDSGRVVNADCQRRGERRSEHEVQQRHSGPSGASSEGSMGNTDRFRERESEGFLSEGGGRLEYPGEGSPLDFWKDHGTVYCQHDNKVRRTPSIESGICLLADGVPGRVGQISGFGNSVSPVVAYQIGGALVASHKQYTFSK